MAVSFFENYKPESVAPMIFDTVLRRFENFSSFPDSAFRLLANRSGMFFPSEVSCVEMSENSDSNAALRRVTLCIRRGARRRSVVIRYFASPDRSGPHCLR